MFCAFLGVGWWESSIKNDVSIKQQLQLGGLLCKIRVRNQRWHCKKRKKTRTKKKLSKYIGVVERSQTSFKFWNSSCLNIYFSWIIGNKSSVLKKVSYALLKGNLSIIIQKCQGFKSVLVSCYFRLIIMPRGMARRLQTELWVSWEILNN